MLRLRHGAPPYRTVQEALPEAEEEVVGAVEGEKSEVEDEEKVRIIFVSLVRVSVCGVGEIKG